MTLLLPVLTFALVFAGVLVYGRRSQRTVAHLARHQALATSATAAGLPRARLPIMEIGKRTGGAGQLAAKLTGAGVRAKSEKLLREAGNPMPVATYLLMRAVFMFVFAPFFVFLIFNQYGFSAIGIIMMVVGGFTFPNLPSLRIKRKARKRARAIEHAMPDALDLLVVSVEGGLSLDGALQQVSRRSDGTLAIELRRLLKEVGGGMGRREALAALGERSQSESLKIFCTTMIQADKMGMSIATTLRTLAGTMRTRRRQAAETQARKAPIKMLPFIIFFMIPSLFIVILGPAVLSIMNLFHNQ
jgi:tight adherence protein C